MELGGFVRYTSLDRQQRGQMFTQKHANLVIWNLRNRAETTDPQTSDPMHDGEKRKKNFQRMMQWWSQILMLPPVELRLCWKT